MTQSLPLSTVPTPAPNARAKPRILLVDDNEDILNILQRSLSREQYELLTARDGVAGLEAARRELPDLVLLDVMMPQKDGLTVCRELKADPITRNIMIVLVTGRGSVDHRAEGLDSGADDYIAKPFHIAELQARVRSSLRIKKLNDELQETSRKLVESQRDRVQAEKMATIGLLATGVAHEFNNIMGGISGFAQLAKKHDKYRDQLVDVALTQCERALELTKSLSTFYRATRSHVRLELPKVVENALCLVTKQIEDRKVSIVKTFNPAPQVQGSPGQIQEVVLNLVINAIHAIHQPAGKIEIRIDPAGDHVVLSIADNGCGIPPENIDRIFDPFFTTKGALGGGKDAGSGLGLSVSYNIVQAHAGRIVVSSEVGRGTTFTVTLPTAAARAESAQSKDGGAETATPSRPIDSTHEAHRQAAAVEGVLWERVILADTEDAVREILAQYLQAREIVHVTDWAKLLEAAARKEAEFMIVDCSLPGFPGVTLAEAALVAVDPNVRVVLTSRQLLGEADRNAMDGFWGHLLKPYTVENLSSMLSRGRVATL